MTIDLTDSVIIDNHAHSLLKRHLEVDAIGFRKSFCEASSMSYLTQHAQNSLHYMNMLTRLRDFLDFKTEDDLIELRQTLSSQEHVNDLWDDASIGALMIDDGYLSDSMMSVNELSKVCQRPTFRILRLEPLFENLIAQESSLAKVEKKLETQLRSSSDAPIFGLKTIAAYRGGLPSETVIDKNVASTSFDTIKKSEGKLRISNSPLYHYLLLRSFELAAAQNLPIQVHSGIGDSDLILHESNPSIMTPILKDRRFSACRFVFLHCYPYHRETSYLCSVFPNCYMDLSLSVILLSAIARNILAETMALAPTTKLLAGTDGHSVPEMHWYGAIVFKESLQTVLNQLITDNYLTVSQAQKASENILYANCRELYNLEGLF